MDDINKKIAEIQALVEVQNKAFKRAARRTVIVYSCLVLFVALYTGFSFHYISEAATPDAIADALIGTIQGRLEVTLKQVRGEMKPGAKQLADTCVDALKGMIPQAGSFARGFLDEQVNAMLDVFEHEHMPVLNKFVDDGVSDVMKHKGDVASGKVGEQLSSLVCERVDAELIKIVDRNFYQSVDSLQERLSQLKNTPVSQLNRRANSEKMFLLYWIYLSEYAPTNQEKDAISSLISYISKSVETVNFTLLEDDN